MITQVPLTFILSEDDFISLDNIDYGMVYSDIVKSQTSNKLKEYTYCFVNDMISGFFKRNKNKENFKICIEKSLVFLKENVPEYNYRALEMRFRPKSSPRQAQLPWGLDWTLENQPLCPTGQIPPPFTISLHLLYCN